MSRSEIICSQYAIDGDGDDNHLSNKIEFYADHAQFGFGNFQIKAISNRNTKRPYFWAIPKIITLI